MTNFDLNLLRIFDALWRHGHLGHASEELELSQPALSHSLKRLREQLGDVLFVKAHSGMQPSARAVQLAPVVQQLLSMVRESVLTTPAFEPKSARRTFTIAMSDVGEMVFLPRLLSQITRESPSVNVNTVSMSPRDMAEAMQRGQVDLALGYFPDLKGSDMFQQRLFGHSFVCLVRHDHPVIQGTLSQEQFLAVPHAVVHTEGRSQEIVEEFFKKRDIVRRGLLNCPHFLSIPMVIASTDMLITVPEPVGQVFAKIGNLQMLEPPYLFPEYDVKQNWHRCQHDDPGNKWLRSVVVKLYNTNG